MTLQQANENITVKKDVFSADWKNYYEKFEEVKADKTATTLLIGKLVTSHSAYLTEISNSITNLLNMYDFLRDKKERMDLEDTISNFTSTSIKYLDAMKRVKDQYYQQDIVPSTYAYRTLQTFINTFSSSSRIEKEKVKFVSNGLDISGFEEKFGKSEKQVGNDRRQIRTSIIMGAISVIIVLGVLLFKNNISPQLSMVIQVLFAIGCAGLSAAIIGALTINLKVPTGIDAVGGFAIFVLIMFFRPVGIPTSFSSSISLQKSSLENVYGKDINVNIKLGQNYKSGELLPSSETYLFNPIAPEYINDSVDLVLTSTTWVFQNGRRRLRIVLNSGNINVAVKRDILSLEVRGIVRLRRPSKVVPKINIRLLEIPTVITVADSTSGVFLLTVPEVIDSEAVSLVISARGYKEMKLTGVKLNAFHEWILE